MILFVQRFRGLSLSVGEEAEEVGKWLVQVKARGNTRTKSPGSTVPPNLANKCGRISRKTILLWSMFRSRGGAAPS